MKINTVPFFWVLLIFLIPLLSGEVVSSQCLEDQKSLLLILKANLTNPSSDSSSSSSRLVNWDSSTDCCTWDGVKCDKSGHVMKLKLDDQTFSGRIDNSSVLFELQYLESLNLAYNNFYSIIPSGLYYKLRNLTYLNLSNAGFYGEISTDLGLMKRLVVLDLSTSFPGFDRLEVGNSNLKVLFQNLTEVEELYLDGVNISAPGIDWGNAFSTLSNLRVLSLSTCYLSGPISTSLSQLSSLSVFNLNNNNLSASVPDFFANFTNLTILSLTSCSLQGRFPQKILQVPTLQHIALSYNDLLTGIIPELSKNASFRTLVLCYTAFSGTLPDSIGFLGNLSMIDLSNCNFSGPIPSTMANLKELVYLDFSANKFNGSIPLFQMSNKLKYIDLSRNFLTGTILSTHFEGLAELYFINLGFNSLEGSIPPSLFTMQSLQKLQLSNNRFDGQIAEFPNASTRSLGVLDLSGNQLKGSIPKSFFELRSLNVLSLSSNGFNGTLQLQMINELPDLTKLELSYNLLLVEVNTSKSVLPQLSVLRLASCNLRTFPNLKNQSKMAILDLSENSIPGEIPTWIWEIGNRNLQQLNLSHNLLSSMQINYTSNNLLVLDVHSNLLQGNFPIPPATAIYVDYSNNNFSNSIPSSIGSYFTYTIYFSSSNNRLTGIIPESICNASYLQILDLSNNILTGSIPSCVFGSMESLKVLQLRSNNINGNIPDNFPTSCVLKTLDLSENGLTGMIPGSIVNCTSLEVLNIGRNSVEDTFPCMLAGSSSLRVLVLRSNKFHGNLSCSAVNNSWQNLQIIDIALNGFSGTLSSSIPYWTGIILGGAGKLGEDLSTNFLSNTNLHYQDSVRMIVKGYEILLEKILITFAAIDFSCNHFQGNLPETVGKLQQLLNFNLSHNSLTGPIPPSIGHLQQLESLDLSFNHLSGEIPTQISDLTFLSSLNVSYNDLVGTIPKGSQIQTFTETSFLGNSGLCGFPINRSCDSSTSPPGFPVLSPEEEESVWESDIYVSAAIGFPLSLIVLCWSLVLNNKWRRWYNYHLNSLVLRILSQEGCF